MLGILLQTGEMKCHSILFTNFPTISYQVTDKSRSFSTFTLFYKRATRPTPHTLVGKKASSRPALALCRAVPAFLVGH